MRRADLQALLLVRLVGDHGGLCFLSLIDPGGAIHNHTVENSKGVSIALPLILMMYLSFTLVMRSRLYCCASSGQKDSLELHGLVGQTVRRTHRSGSC